MRMIGTGTKDDLYDISDSTDWLGTPLATLAPIEAALRCQVCKDFYKTPMITSCSHTFCSTCIRRCLANDGKCPTCRITEQEIKLRSNWTIEGLVEDFLEARPSLLSYSRNGAEINKPTSPKRKLDTTELDDEILDQPSKKIRSSSRISARSMERANTISSIPGSDEDEYIPDNGLVPCPVCSTRMKVESIDSHLNKCLVDSSRNKAATSVSILTSGIAVSASPRTQRPSNNLDRLPQLNYSLFKEGALRKKLQDLGISGHGSRQLLERRHAEWVTLWNANCDASKPRMKSDLLQELDIWERTQGGRAPSSSSGLHTGSQLLRKDFDGAGWAAKHEQSFQDLITSARMKMIKKEPTAEQPGTSKLQGRRGHHFEASLSKQETTSVSSRFMEMDGKSQSPISLDQSSSDCNERPLLLNTAPRTDQMKNNDQEVSISNHKLTPAKPPYQSGPLPVDSGTSVPSDE